MTEQVEIAKNKDEGLKFSITATGRKLGAVAIKGGSLYRIALIDGKHGGSIPEKYQGLYTALHYAKFDLDKLVAETWDIAEEHTTKKTKSVNAAS